MDPKGLLKDKILYVTSQFTKGVDVTDSSETVTIEGYANTTSVDRQGDIIPTTAWESGLVNYLKNPIMLAYHNHDQPIGRMVDHKIDSHGLWIKADISSADKKLFDLVKAGVLTAFSVGFRILDAAYDSMLDLFIIKELELLEISVVSVPANQDSIFSLAKSFDSAEDLASFKKQYIPEPTTIVVPAEPKTITNKGITSMTPEEIAAMIAKATAEATQKAMADAEAKQAEKDRIAKAADAAEAALSARVAAEVAKATASITVGTSGAEKLIADLEKRFNDESVSNKSVIEGLQAEIKEKAAEMAAMQNSKMNFADKKGADGVSYADKETAVLLSVVSGKGMTETKYGSELRTKAGPHVPGAVPWELEVSMNMENDIRRRLVIAPALKAIAMKTNVMKIPLNPDAGVGTWVTNGQFGTDASSGATQVHQLQEITLSAYKVATREYMNYEEEEDSLIVLLPIIRDAMVRRVARAVDIAYLRGAGSGADPVKGLATYATANTTNAVGTAVTVSKLREMRKNLGYFGLDPSEVTFFVSTDVYYDLLEDPVFQTMNQVGDRATLVTGQIGLVGNSPVVISGEFEARATGKIGAIALNSANFIAGNQRGLRFDTQELVESQKRVLVSSLRTGLTQLTTSQGMGVSKLTFTA